MDSAQKNPGHRFKPGNTYGRGNPMSRAVNQLRVKLIEELERRGVSDLVSWLWEIAADPKNDSSTRIAAIKELLNRGCGKAEQLLNHEITAGEGAVVRIELDQQLKEWAQ